MFFKFIILTILKLFIWFVMDGRQYQYKQNEYNNKIKNQIVLH